MKRFWFGSIVLLALLLGACGADPEEQQRLAEEEQYAQAIALLEEDLAWMETKNTDVHAPTDDARIIDEATKQPLGPSVRYDTDDTRRYSLFGSFHGERIEFILGWEGPNVHHVSYVQADGPVRERVAGGLRKPFEPLITDFGFSLPNTEWQMTLADVDDDGMLEVIVYALHEGENPGDFHQGYLAIFHYVGGDEMFELAANFHWENQSYRSPENPARFNEYGEWLVEHLKNDTVLGYCEDGEWYAYLPAEHNVGTMYVIDPQTDEATREREPSPYPATTARQTTTVSCDDRGGDCSDEEEEEEDDDTDQRSRANERNDATRERTFRDNETISKEEVDLIEANPLLEKAATSCRDKEDGCAGTDEDVKERATRAVVFYIERSIIARRDGQYAVAAPYIAPNSPIEADMKQLVPSDAAQGVSMTYVDFEPVGVDQVNDTTYNVTLRNTFDISGTERTGHRQFESVFRTTYDPSTDQFFVHELVSEREL